MLAKPIAPSEGLFIKTRCSVCRGKTRGCPYCDSEGKHYLEATVKRIGKWLSEQSEEDKELYREALKEA